MLFQILPELLGHIVLADKLLAGISPKVEKRTSDS